ncbi:hypothetical protein, partial [Neobacillus cucumis]|uniref:hypothetical protein n=1 Tax=Neobacillus cucumis TaxID=1740721 RepID=UPI002E1C2EA3|nr:hypothetical protein [Neobacillus cucumis]
MGPKEKERVYDQYKRLGMNDEKIAEKMIEYEEREAEERAEKKRKGDEWKAKYGVRKPPGWQIHYENAGLYWSDRYQTQEKVMRESLQNEKLLGRVLYIQRADGSERLERDDISLDDYKELYADNQEQFTGAVYKNKQIQDEVITIDNFLLDYYYGEMFLIGNENEFCIGARVGGNEEKNFPRYAIQLFMCGYSEMEMFFM